MRPVLRLGQRAQEQRRGVDGRVQDGGPQPALDDLAAANLVEDLARLLLASRVHDSALVLREVAQDAPRQLGVEVEQQDRRDQRVAPERDRVPGQPARGVEAGVEPVAQHAEVRGRLSEELVELGVVGAHGHALGGPPREHLLALAQAGREIDRRPFTLFHHIDLEVEVLAREQSHLVLQAFGERDHVGGVAAAVEPHAVDGLFRLDRLWAGELGHRATDAEHGGEVAPHLELDDGVGRHRAAVGERDPLVQAGVDEAHALDVQRSCDELERRGCIARAQTREVRLDPVDEQPEMRQHARVLRPDTVTGKLAGTHRAVARGDGEKAVAFEHHALGDELTGRDQDGRLVCGIGPQFAPVKAEVLGEVSKAGREPNG